MILENQKKRQRKREAATMHLVHDSQVTSLPFQSENRSIQWHDLMLQLYLCEKSNIPSIQKNLNNVQSNDYIKMYQYF